MPGANRVATLLFLERCPQFYPITEAISNSGARTNSGNGPNIILAYQCGCYYPAYSKECSMFFQVTIGMSKGGFLFNSRNSARQKPGQHTQILARHSE